ncbi:MAG: M48 family metalloprotease [Ramlibacter sp.]|nr:M48 family metalloprotease [Ramlibacter sp.]
MSPRRLPHRAVRARLTTGALGALLVLAPLAPLAQAQSGDAAKALNFLNSLVRPQGSPAAPAAGNPLSQMLGGSAPSSASNAAAAGDLVQLLAKSVEQIDEPKEIEIGRQLAAVLLGSKPLHPDMKLQRYVNQLGRWISLQSSRPQLPWSFAVLDDPGFNAFAAPGGYVFVTKGLIDRVGNEAELAGILAHEISHVTGKHHLKAIGAKARAGALTQVISSQLNNNLGGMVSAQLLALGRDLYSSGLDQGDEFEADRNGIALAARAGFDPYGLVAVLQQLRAAAADDPLFALSLSTHPPAQQRLDQVEAAMGSRLDAFAGKPSVSLAQRVGTP